MAAGARCRQEARRVRADRAGRWLGRGEHAHDGRAPRRILGDQRLEALHHQRRDRHHVGRDDHRPYRRRRDLERRGRERDSGLHDLRADEEARLAGVRHARALLRGLRRSGGEPPRRARRRLQAVPRDPGRRTDLGRGDGRRPRAGRVRPRLRVREGAGAVRKADLELPGGPSSRSRTWRRRSRPGVRSF